MNTKRGSKRSIRAVTPVIGEVLMIAITLSVGFATWAWVGSSANHSETSINNVVGNNLGQLNENYEIIYANFSKTAQQSVTLWFYNYGSNSVNVKQLYVSNGTLTSSPITALSMTYFSGCGYCLNIAAGGSAHTTISAGSIGFVSGAMYQFKAVAMYGRAITYQLMR